MGTESKIEGENNDLKETMFCGDLEEVSAVHTSSAVNKSANNTG